MLNCKGKQKIFSISGPNLPKRVTEHSMVEYGDSLLLIGGYDDDSYELLNSIFSLTCESRICVWTELSHKLSIGRMDMVTAIIPDSMTNCSAPTTIATTTTASTAKTTASSAVTTTKASTGAAAAVFVVYSRLRNVMTNF